MTIDTLTFANDRTPLDLLLYRHYRAEIPGLVEATLAQNRGLAALGAFPPPGTTILVTTPAPARVGTIVRKIVRLYD